MKDKKYWEKKLEDYKKHLKENLDDGMPKMRVYPFVLIIDLVKYITIKYYEYKIKHPN